VKSKKKSKKPGNNLSQSVSIFVRTRPIVRFRGPASAGLVPLSVSFGLPFEEYVMKKVLALVVAFGIAATVVGCGGGSSTGSTTSTKK
jgi:hypothetical protein